tara:strand:- start:1424 stop:1888 length:465 start_codon:yes stop_codon:yes gene_type:complete
MQKRKDYIKELIDIKDFVESKYDIVLTDRKRDDYSVEARALYYMIAIDETGATLGDIGKLVGRSHASVINSRKLFSYYISIDRVNRYHSFYTNTSLEVIKSGVDWNTIELTENEIKYRLLTDSQKSVYDERMALVLKSFEWEIKEEFETIICAN